MRCFFYFSGAFVGFFLTFKAISLLFKPKNQAYISPNNHLIAYFILLIAYSALLYFAAININHSLPFIDNVVAIFKSPLSIRAQIAQLSSEGLIRFSGFLGIFIFFMNMIPLAHLIGNFVLMLIYESLTNDKTLEDRLSKFNAAVSVLFLCFVLWFFYKLFF